MYRGCALCCCAPPGSQPIHPFTPLTPHPPHATDCCEQEDSPDLIAGLAWGMLEAARSGYTEGVAQAIAGSVLTPAFVAYGLSFETHQDCHEHCGAFAPVLTRACAPRPLPLTLRGCERGSLERARWGVCTAHTWPLPVVLAGCHNLLTYIVVLLFVLVVTTPAWL
jgi:hypothetical protein